MKRLFALLLTAFFLLASCTAPKHEEHKSSAVSSGAPEPSAPASTTLHASAVELLALAEKAWDGDEIPSIWDTSETDDYTIDWGFGRFTRANVFTQKGEDAPCAVILSITPGNDFVFSEYAIYPFKLMLKKLGVAENDLWGGDKQIIVGKTYHGDGFLYILKKIEKKYFLCLYAEDFAFDLSKMPTTLPGKRSALLDSAEKREALRELRKKFDFKGMVELVEAYEAETPLADDAHVLFVKKLAEEMAPLQEKCVYSYDDFEGETSVFYKDVEKISKQVHVVPYLSSGSAFTDVGFIASKWLFFDDWTIKAGDSTLSGGSSSDYREVLSGGSIIEISRTNVLSLDKIQAVREMGSAKLRFSNDDNGKNLDFDLSAAEIDALYTIHSMQAAGRQIADYIYHYDLAFGAD